jgi:hypothetical protein
MSRPYLPVAATTAVLAAIACGRATQPAAAPAEPAPPPAKAPIAAEPAAGGAAAVEPSAAGAASDEEEGLGRVGLDEVEADDPEEPEAAATPPPMPSELLVANGVAFLLDDPGSDLKERLTKKCEQRITEDHPEKIAECRSKERNKFGADVFVFRKQPGGGLRWQIYQRTGSILKEVYSARIELVDERETAFEIKPLDGSGNRHIFKGQHNVPVSMPSKHELVLEDPQYGKLIYRAKIGLVGKY